MKYQRLQDLREDNDLRQKDVAEFLHVGARSYSHYEFGSREVPIEILSQLADHYKTSIDYLVGRTDVKKPYPKSQNLNTK